MAIVPIWHTPDEQIHFAQVTFVSEKWRNPTGTELDYSAEIDLSTAYLGTQRDKFGNNQFTHHPLYKIEYGNTYQGKNEAEITLLANTSARTTFVKKESSRYPLIYYYPAAIVLKLLPFGDIFTRVMAVRILNLGLFLVTVYIYWKWAKKIFNDKPLFSWALTILIGFQPMYIFSNIGVTSDSLGNLVFAAYIYFLTVMVQEDARPMNLFWFLTITFLAPLVKPQFFITIPISLLFLTGYLIYNLRQKSWKPILVTGILGVIISFFFLKTNLGPTTVFNNLKNNFSLSSLLKYTWEYSLPHTYKEVLPWYFGVFKWLGVTYSRTVHRIINRFLIFALIGFGIWFVRSLIGKRKAENFKLILILGSLALFFYSALAVYDWLSWSMTGYQLGIQGRYLFPAIGIHMLLMLIGWQQLWPQKYKSIGIKLLGLLMIALNFFALWTVSNSYYDLSSFQSFIIQASQYKPWFFKGTFLVILLGVYLILTVVFIVNFIRLGLNYVRQKNFQK